MDKYHHGHHHGPHHGHDHASKNLSVAFFLNLIFALIELVGGILTNSVAILSDALHDFGDSISLGISWALHHKAQQGRDAQYSYGYKRFSLLGAVFLSGMLTVSSLYMLVEAIKRIFNPEPVDAQGMIWLALLGVAVNGAAAFRLQKGSSLNERAVYLHIMEDVLGWVAVLLAGIAMRFAHLPILDSLLSVGISLWVLRNVYKNGLQVSKVFLQAVPEDVRVDDLRQQIEGIEGVDSLHDLHVWSLDGESHVMTLHVVTAQPDAQAIKAQVVAIAEQHHISHVTIELEGPDSTCLTRCD